MFRGFSSSMLSVGERMTHPNKTSKTRIRPSMKLRSPLLEIELRQLRRGLDVGKADL
jgi:hypothetical protein